MPGDWTAQFHHAGLGRGHQPARSPARCCAASLTSAPASAARGCTSPALGVYERTNQRRGRRRSGHGARLDQLRPPAALPDLDVTACCTEGRNAIGAMLGDGWYRGRLGYRRRPAQHLRRPPGAAGPARNRRTPTARASASSPTRPGAPPPGRSWPATSTTAKPTMPGWSGRAGPRRASTTATGRRAAGGRGPGDAGRADRARRCAAPKLVAPVAIIDLARPGAPSSTSARTWSAGCA